MLKIDTEKYTKELFKLLSIPSISAQTKHKNDIQNACKWLSKRLKTLKFNTKILPTQGHPVVYGENLNAGDDKPTILIYGHYDVQDPGDPKEWTSNPFKPEVRSGNIYARGASDDKGNFYTWIAAIDTLFNESKSLPVNVKFLIEGEEEVASQNLHEFVSENKSLLEADFVAVSDTDCLSESQPLITYGLRGIVYYEIKVKTLTKDVHSGTYGGNVLNPINVLSSVISKIKDDKHKILIPGAYDNLRKISSSEMKKIEKLPLDEKNVLQETGAYKVVGEKGYSVIERKGTRPTFDVNGIWGGYQEEGPKTIIPSTARAKLSFRLVPNQNADEFSKKFEIYIDNITPEGAKINLELLGADNPIVMNLENDFYKSAEKAIQKIFGTKPIYQLVGGSIPATSIFKEVLGLESLLMGYALPDDAHHSPNEKMSLSMFNKGIETNIEFINDLSKTYKR
jgi:acetylornithine deacetylase/succinyl-diaminopimelate desuccinylase-like protein